GPPRTRPRIPHHLVPVQRGPTIQASQRTTSMGMFCRGPCRCLGGALGSAEPLDQVDVIVPMRVAGGAAALLVAETGIETGCLEGVGAQGNLVAAAALDLLFGFGQQPGSQARATLVVSHPEQVDVAASAPCPAPEPCAQIAAASTDSDAQEPTVTVTC